MTARAVSGRSFGTELDVVDDDHVVLFLRWFLERRR